MIIFIFGQARAGKSTFVRENYIGTDSIQFFEPYKYMTSGGNLIIGDYSHKKRTKRIQGPDGIKQTREALMHYLGMVIEKYRLNCYKNIIIEGAFFCNKTSIDYLKDCNCKVILIEISIEEGLRRTQAMGMDTSRRRLERTKKHAYNIYQYAIKRGYKHEYRNQD